MKGKNKGFMTLWLVLLCCALLITGTYAAYSSVQSFKSVVVAKSENKDIRFSSNHLSLRLKGEDAPVKLISVGTQSEMSVAVTVCNYPQSDISKVHEMPITYDLEVEVLDAAGNLLPEDSELREKLWIKELGRGVLSRSGETLPGGNAAQNVYTVCCAVEDIPLLSRVSVKMTAIPQDCEECDLGNYILTGRLKFTAANSQDTDWTGEFTCKDSDTTVLDAFNYEIKGTAEQTVTLRWDTGKVTLSRWSLADLPVQGTADMENGLVTLNLGGVGNPTSYVLQFYRVGGIPTGETLSTVEGYVTFPAQ